jgi:hypothetical protein
LAILYPDTVTAGTQPATLEGEVLDSLGNPVDRVEINVVGANLRSTTNSVGAFSIRSIQPGNVRLQVRKIGFGAGEIAVALSPGETRRVTVTLSRVSNQLAPVVVEERPVHQSLRELGFYERSEGIRGTFLTPELLAHHATTRASDLFRGINGVQLLLTPSGGLPYSHGGYIHLGQNGICKMNLYIDGTRTDLIAPGETLGNTTITLDDVISPNDIGAIEVYPSGVTTPQKYTGVSQGCGTILIWTKVKLNAPTDTSRTN